MPPGSVGQCSLHICTSGTVDDDSNSTTQCRPCMNGTYIPKGSVGSCTTFSCPIGTYDHDLNPASSCRPCRHGYYQPRTGSVLCNQTTPCAQGQGELTPPTSSTDRVCSSIAYQCANLSSIDPQPLCSRCSAGFYLNSTSCSICPSGSMCTDGVTATQCPAGTYQPATGASGCFDCPLGSTKVNQADLYCTPCSGESFLPRLYLLTRRVGLCMLATMASTEMALLVMCSNYHVPLGRCVSMGLSCCARQGLIKTSRCPQIAKYAPQEHTMPGLGVVHHVPRFLQDIILTSKGPLILANVCMACTV